MELFQEILAAVFEREHIRVTFPNMHINTTEILELESYKAIRQIRAILENNRLSDPDCFVAIEDIVSLFEAMGSSCEGRHDFV